MSLEEIKAEFIGMSAFQRKELAAFLVSLRHKDLAIFRQTMARKIDDTDPANWLTLEEFDLRLQASSA